MTLSMTVRCLFASTDLVASLAMVALEWSLRDGRNRRLGSPRADDVGATMGATTITMVRVFTPFLDVGLEWNSIGSRDPRETRKFTLTAQEGQADPWATTQSLPRPRNRWSPDA